MSVSQHCAASQVNFGTIVVVSYTSRYAVVAADSRMLVRGTVVDDNHCKITTVKNDFIFTGFGTEGETGNWEMTNVARDVADSILTSSVVRDNSVIDRIAKRWEDSAANWLRSLSTSQIREITTRMGERAMGAYFVLRLADSSLALRFVTVNVHETSNGQVGVEPSNPIPLTFTPGGHSTATGGSTTIPSLFVAHDKPDFILQEQALLAAIPEGIERSRREARRYVELAIEQNDPSVGGHANIAEITASGTRWLTDHEECKNQ